MGRASCTSFAAASAHSFGEEEYIDLDLSSCGEYEFRVCRTNKAAAPCADELLSRGRLHKVAPRPSGKPLDPDAAAACGGSGGGRRSTATVAPLQQHPQAGGIRCLQPAAEGSRRKKPGKAAVHAKLQASRAFFRSLFARTSCSDKQCHRGIGVRSASTGRTTSGKAAFGQIKSSCYSVSGGGAAPTTLRSSIEQEKLMDEEELSAASSSSRQRKSFSGVIKWRPATATGPPSKSNPAPAWASTTTRRNSSGEHGPALKRSSSCRSESEGLIQGAIAYCKRSQQQRVLARKSVSDAALCSSRPS